MRYFFLLLLLTNSVYSKENDCSVTPPEALYSHLSPGLKNYKVKKLNGTITEMFTIDSIESVSISQGGCAHYSETVEFKFKKESERGFNKSKWIEKTLELLRKLPDSKTRKFSKTLIDEIERQKKSLLKNKLEISKNSKTIRASDAQGFNTIQITLQTTNKFSILSISLDVSL